MTKLKTKSGAKKRFQVKKSGAVKFRKAFARHNAGSKNGKRGLRLRGTSHLELVDAKKVIKELFPYGG
ncbi:MAG: 50S ribosomal protein L35 [Myxococcales bacterium]